MVLKQHTHARWVDWNIKHILEEAIIGSVICQLKGLTQPSVRPQWQRLISRPSVWLHPIYYLLWIYECLRNDHCQYWGEGWQICWVPDVF